MTTNLQKINPAAPPDLRALKPPVEIPDYWLWLWIALGALAAALAIFFAVRHWMKKAATPVIVPVVPPHERARLKLQEALALLSQPRPFCILVSDTIRVYLEERFSFHAPERTTEEFLHELQESIFLQPAQKESLRDFLSLCDMVKFARYEPGPPELEALHQSAIRLVDETEPYPEPAESAAIDKAKT